MNFWKTLKEQLQIHQNLILLLVVESLGSSPGRQGFKMFIAPDGNLFGSVGGGVMEFKLVEEAKKQLKVQDENIYLKRQVHRGDRIAGSGMICSGEQTVAFIPLNGNHLSKIADLVLNQNGILEISENGLFYQKNVILNQKFDFKKIDENHWDYKEQIHQKPKLYIIGGGHVGAATANLCHQLDFDVTVYDNRPNLNTFINLTNIKNKAIIDYKNIANFVEEGSNHYVVIMTHGYKDDKQVLAPLLGKQFKFLGVLGSKSKLKVMFEVLKNEGFSDAVLAKVHAPLGLFIKSETPEEIAVSIAAQLIKIKNLV